MENILIVEDTEIYADLIDIYLCNEGYRIFKASNAKEATDILEETKIDLIVLDIILPDLNGFELCKKIREKYSFPIIMLTSVDDDEHMVEGLMSGADDYITKPANPKELIARVKTQLRRYTTYNDMFYGIKEMEYNIRGLKISRKDYRCVIDGMEVKLTPTEFEILYYLCENKNNIVKKEELFKKIWGENIEYSHSKMATNMGRLREKISDNAKTPRFIKNIWGIGYIIEE